jgi:dipeptidyl aminopeptidase/acylaminoacyl peptidase
MLSFARRSTVLSLAFLLTTAAVAAAEPAALHPITHEDVWLMKRLGAVAVSPDGRWMIVAVAEPAYDDKEKASDLWIVPTDGSAPPRRLTAGKAGESSPVFSRDSTRLAFTGKRDGDETPQVYVLDLEGGEAQRVTNWATGAQSPQFSPDGRSILFQSQTYPGALTDEDNRKAIAERKARKYNIRAYDSFPIRHWDRWLDEQRPTIVVQALDGSSPARDLLAGTVLRRERGYGGRLTNDGDELDAVWTPDGRGVVFAATTHRDESARADVFTSLWQVSVDGAEPHRLTSDENNYSAPEFTPDGSTLLAKVQPKSDRYVYVAARLAAWSWPAPGARRLLTADFDEAVDDYVAAPDSARVYFSAMQSGHRKLYSAALGAGGAMAEVGDLQAGTYSRLAIGGPTTAPVLCAVWASAVHPAEAGRIDLATGRWSALTSFNAERAASIDWQPVEEFWFKSRAGQQIHSFIVRPAAFDPARKYPLFVVIHGGPHSTWQDDFVLRWNYHLLANPGYVLLLTDYRGSVGYGEAFARSIQGDPLVGPGNDINEAADEAIRRYPFIDATRQAAGGGSYGGHLSNWLAATTDRYRALVSHAGLYDLKTQWTTSDNVYDRERNIGGPAWKDLPLWRRQSPFYHSPTLRTPVLITCGEHDYRVPCNNAMEFFMVLQRQNVPSRLVLFPDENHWIMKGDDSRRFYQEVGDWLAKYL